MACNRIVHPGRVLLETVLRPYEISQNALAGAMGVPPRRINEIILGKRAITADTAIGLEEVIGLSARYWIALQTDYDIAIARNGWDRRHPRRKAMRPLEDWSCTY